MLLLITTKRRRDVLGKTLKGGRAPDREWGTSGLYSFYNRQHYRLQFFYTRDSPFVSTTG